MTITWQPIRHLLFVALLVFPARALACADCDEDMRAFERRHAKDVYVLRDMYMTIRDNISGEKTNFKVEEIGAQFLAPHGFDCTVGGMTWNRQYTIKCENGAEKGEVSLQCGYDPAQSRWDGNAANGMSVVSISLSCE